MLTACALLGLGVIMVGSAGMVVGREERATLSAILFGPEARLALLAITGMLIAFHLPIKRILTARGIFSPAPYLMLASIGMLAAIQIPGVGREENGAVRWLDLGPIGFQPSEIAKWSMPVALACLMTRRPGALGRFFSGLCPLLILIAIVGVLIVKEDLGTGALVVGVAMIMMLAAGARVFHLALLIPPAAAGLFFAVQSVPYRAARLRAFLEPFDDPTGGGYHMIQSLAAISGGGAGGRGLGNGIQKFGYLPEDTTDFIFSVISEELGLLGALFVLVLYGTLIMCGRAVVSAAREPVEKLVALGIMLTLGLQALINLAVVTGLAPTKGIALPLISHGGTGWCLTAAALGVLCAIDRESEHAEAAPTPTLRDDVTPEPSTPGDLQPA